jgi:large subunit ribosomal protein L21
MYAVILSGGKQYKVAEGETLKLEKIDNELGSSVEFNEVLMVINGEDVKIGTPYLKNAKVIGEIVDHGRDDKIDIIKFRRRKHYMKHQGHRQHFTAIKISKIEG